MTIYIFCTMTGDSCWKSGGISCVGILRWRREVTCFVIARDVYSWEGQHWSPFKNRRWWLWGESCWNQNALQRLLDVTLDEHCSRIGLVGPHNLLLFGSEIVTCEIATASASTKPQSSCSSFSWLKLSDDEFRLESSSTKLLSLIFLLEFGINDTGKWWDPGWFFVFDLKDNVLKVRSV